LKCSLTKNYNEFEAEYVCDPHAFIESRYISMPPLIFSGFIAAVQSWNVLQNTR